MQHPHQQQQHNPHPKTGTGAQPQTAPAQQSATMTMTTTITATQPAEQGLAVAPIANGSDIQQLKTIFDANSTKTSELQYLSIKDFFSIAIENEVDDVKALELFYETAQQRTAVNSTFLKSKLTNKQISFSDFAHIMLAAGWRKGDYKIIEITNTTDINLHNLFEEYTSDKSSDHLQQANADSKLFFHIANKNRIMSPADFIGFVKKKQIEDYVKAAILYDFYKMNDGIDFDAFRIILMILEFRIEPPKDEKKVTKEVLRSFDVVKNIKINFIFGEYEQNSAITFEDFWLICYNFGFDLITASSEYQKLGKTSLTMEDFMKLLEVLGWATTTEYSNKVQQKSDQELRATFNLFADSIAKQIGLEQTQFICLDYKLDEVHAKKHFILYHQKLVTYFQFRQIIMEIGWSSESQSQGLGIEDFEELQKIFNSQMANNSRKMTEDAFTATIKLLKLDEAAAKQLFWAEQSVSIGFIQFISIVIKLGYQQQRPQEVAERIERRKSQKNLPMLILSDNQKIDSFLETAKAEAAKQWESPEPKSIQNKTQVEEEVKQNVEQAPIFKNKLHVTGAIDKIKQMAAVEAGPDDTQDTQQAGAENMQGPPKKRKRNKKTIQDSEQLETQGGEQKEQKEEGEQKE